jgi:hypothetical protein
LGVPQPKGLGVLAPRLNPPHAQKTLQSGLNSSDRHLERLERRRSPFARAVTQAATRIADEISKGAIRIPSSIGEVAPFAQGLTAVKKTTASLQDLLVAVQKGKVIAEAADDGNAMGAIFKSACWLDELFFGG